MSGRRRWRWTAFRIARTVWRAVLPQSLRLRARLGRPIPYEPEVTRALRRVTRPGATCADVGANLGELTQTFLDCAGPTGRVVAFEAHPETARALAERFSAGNVTVVSAAVSDGAVRRVLLYPSPARRSAEWNIVGHDPDGRTTAAELEVDAVALDDYFRPGERLDVVKIDVEGAEALVLAGMRRLLRQARPSVLVEFHDDEGWAGRHELLEAGYVLTHPDGKPLDPEGPRVYHVLALPPQG